MAESKPDRVKAFETNTPKAIEPEMVVDISKIEPDREILNLRQGPDGSEVTEADPNFDYKWVNPWGSGRFITKAQAQGWRLVSDSRGDKECPHLIDSQGYRRRGDVVLMKIPKERKAELDRQDAARRARILGSTTQELEDVASKSRYLTLHVGANALAKIPGMRKLLAKQLASSKLDSMLREGNLPGLKTP